MPESFRSRPYLWIGAAALAIIVFGIAISRARGQRLTSSERLVQVATSQLSRVSHRMVATVDVRQQTSKPVTLKISGEVGPDGHGDWNYILHLPYTRKARILYGKLGAAMVLRASIGQRGTWSCRWTTSVFNLSGVPGSAAISPNTYATQLFQAFPPIPDWSQGQVTSQGLTLAGRPVKRIVFHLSNAASHVAFSQTEVRTWYVSSQTQLVQFRDYSLSQFSKPKSRASAYVTESFGAFGKIGPVRKPSVCERR